MNDIKVVTFDCDGVLFDTIKANIAYYNQILEHFNKPGITPEQFAYIQMHTVDKSLSFLFKDKETLEKANAYRKTMTYLPFLKYMEMEPYLKPLLKKLRPKYKSAIATNRSDTISRLLSEYNLTEYFDIVVSTFDVARPKPYPDSLVKILEHFKIEPRQAIFVGDSELDEIAANAAGVPFVAYKNKSLKANFHINNFKELEVALFPKIEKK